jgi:hypothetical protein
MESLGYIANNMQPDLFWNILGENKLAASNFLRKRGDEFKTELINKSVRNIKNKTGGIASSLNLLGLRGKEYEMNFLINHWDMIECLESADL